ncbi:hypothetical protein ACIBJF_45810 [Streptomyces sp. NPDC050743]|uniref:hypothetical protein n=1 Tax=Streptomyces sp. NPDC050743 TaxID=3365634 RepID=UPI0037ACAEE6
MLLVNLRGQDELEQWTTDAEAGSLPELRGLATGLRKGGDAVMALHGNSGPMEGHVDRIKVLRRHMFGRAKPDLLRKRVLLAS